MTSPVALLLGTPAPEGTEQAASAQGAGGDLFAGALAAALAVSASAETVALPLAAVPDAQEAAPTEVESEGETGRTEVLPEEQEAAGSTQPDKIEDAAAAAFPVVALLVHPAQVEAAAPEIQLPNAPATRTDSVASASAGKEADGTNRDYPMVGSRFEAAEVLEAPARAEVPAAAAAVPTPDVRPTPDTAPEPVAATVEQAAPVKQAAWFEDAPVIVTAEPVANPSVPQAEAGIPIVQTDAPEPFGRPEAVRELRTAAVAPQPEARVQQPERERVDQETAPGPKNEEPAPVGKAAATEVQAAPASRPEQEPHRKQQYSEEQPQEQKTVPPLVSGPLPPAAPQQTPPQVQAQAAPVIPAAPMTAPAAPTMAQVSAEPLPKPISTDAATLEQVVTGAKLAVSSKATDLTVQLDPPGLGRLHVKVSLSAGEISARLSADNPATYNLIASHQADIRESLGQAGLRLDQLTVLDFGAASQGFDRRDQSSGGSYPGNNPSSPGFYWQQQLADDEPMTTEQTGFGRINYLA